MKIENSFLKRQILILPQKLWKFKTKKKIHFIQNLLKCKIEILILTQKLVSFKFEILVENCGNFESKTYFKKELLNFKT